MNTRREMPSDRDIYMAANMLVKQHGAEAAIFAAINADQLAEKGDRAGQAVWLRVIDAIKVIEAKAPATGAAVQ